jgi:hypothetical protein
MELNEDFDDFNDPFDRYLDTFEGEVIDEEEDLNILSKLKQYQWMKRKRKLPQLQLLDVLHGRKGNLHNLSLLSAAKPTRRQPTPMCNILMCIWILMQPM